MRTWTKSGGSIVNIASAAALRALSWRWSSDPGHFGVPDDVAHAVVFLASPGAGNGVDLPVDGGYGIS
ncbi:MAG TPA: hypothetical protein VK053_23795 [Jiangellaceae bacterium]|nr:hypothetical protein [Jiangellaceae bacterium]